MSSLRVHCGPPTSGIILVRTTLALGSLVQICYKCRLKFSLACIIAPRYFIASLKLMKCLPILLPAVVYASVWSSAGTRLAFFYHFSTAVGTSNEFGRLSFPWLREDPIYKQLFKYVWSQFKSQFWLCLVYSKDPVLLQISGTTFALSEVIAAASKGGYRL